MDGRMILRIVVAILLFSLPAQARMTGHTLAGGSNDFLNDFSADSDVVALWKLDDGALTTDSKGTNTLTDIGTVTANTSVKMEGTASGNFVEASSQGLYRTNSNLAADFPLKDQVTPVKTISVCAWVYNDSFATDGNGLAIFSIYERVTNKKSFVIFVSTYGTDNVFELGLGYNGGASVEWIPHAYDLSLSTWYHVTVVYQDSDKSYGIYVRDTNGNTIGSDLTGTATLDVNKINVEDAPLSIGVKHDDAAVWSDHFDGKIDEVVVFKRKITAAEATKIAKGIYP
jgi:hypothetical protein